MMGVNIGLRENWLSCWINTEWRNFTKVIDKAMIACKNSCRNAISDFVDVNKIVAVGATERRVKDYELSRYACYLIVQNDDLRKEVIALGQTYFAIQTYRQEIADKFNQLDEDSRRHNARGFADTKKEYRSTRKRATCRVEAQIQKEAVDAG